MLPLYGGPELNSKQVRQNLASCKGFFYYWWGGTKSLGTACLGITGAMRSGPTAAMEVLLGLPPLHLQWKWRPR
jgi:hypothetical protein